MPPPRYAMHAYRFYYLIPNNRPPLERIFYNDHVAVNWQFKSADADGVEYGKVIGLSLACTLGRAKALQIAINVAPISSRQV